MTPSKESMLNALPVCEEPLTLRKWTKADTHARAKWLSYPPEYRNFNFVLSGAPTVFFRGYAGKKG